MTRLYDFEDLKFLAVIWPDLQKEARRLRRLAEGVCNGHLDDTARIEAKLDRILSRVDEMVNRLDLKAYCPALDPQGGVLYLIRTDDRGDESDYRRLIPIG